MMVMDCCSRIRALFFPKCWFPLSLAIIYFGLSLAIFYVYLMMKKITTTFDRIEGIPCYVVVIHVSFSPCWRASLNLAGKEGMMTLMAFF